MKHATAYKKTYTEVLHRDDLTCQTCGKRAPQVVLECVGKDSKAGENLKNQDYFITSCSDCIEGVKREGLFAYLRPNPMEQLEWEIKERQKDYHPDLLKTLKFWHKQSFETHIPFFLFKLVNRLLKEYSSSLVTSAMHTVTETYIDKRPPFLDPKSYKAACLNLSAVCRLKFNASSIEESHNILPITKKLKGQGFDWNNLPFEY